MGKNVTCLQSRAQGLCSKLRLAPDGHYVSRMGVHMQINRMVIIATTCIVGGCVLLVVFGNQSGATYTVKQLTQLYGK